MEKERYKIYFYNSPFFLILSQENIIDINLIEREQAKILEIKYFDQFFDLNLKHTKCQEFSITIQTFDNSNKFISQIDIYGEEMKFSSDGEINILEFDYLQITTNKGWPSVPDIFKEGEINYFDSKKIFLRNQSINEILN